MAAMVEQSRAACHSARAQPMLPSVSASVPLCDVCYLLQALGLLVQVEGVRFSRRVPTILPLLLSSLQKGVQTIDSEQELIQSDEEDLATRAVSGWQEVYACLLLLERLAITLPTQVCAPTALLEGACMHACSAALYCLPCILCISRETSCSRSW